MEFTFAHSTTQQAAIRKIKEALASPERKKAEQHISDTKEEWKDNVLNFGFTIQGQAITGTLTVTDTEYQIYAKLPFMLRLFEGRIEKEIKKQAAELLKQHSG